ncbi:site-specific DNA-methyltransferase [Candidatus Saccharibacteria bacterium]|nr:site-specific DNA-methyltransferase [Candidatus Saccharibacteria bacterium]
MKATCSNGHDFEYDEADVKSHFVMCADSTVKYNVEKLMDGKKADMVLTDPPYNINYSDMKGKFDTIANDKMSDEDFVEFLKDTISTEAETYYVCCSWQYSHLFRQAMEDIGKPVKSFIVWNKVNPAQNLDKYFKAHEIILYSGKFGGQKTLRSDVWEVKREKNTDHPTMKPIELLSYALKDTPEARTIYDPFLGSGSTLIACEQTDRTCFGMELDEKYVDVVRRRYHKFVTGSEEGWADGTPAI